MLINQPVMYSAHDCTTPTMVEIQGIPDNGVTHSISLTCLVRCDAHALPGYYDIDVLSWMSSRFLLKNTQKRH